jgi:peptide/nickel transport system substrate-binding protein
MSAGNGRGSANNLAGTGSKTFVGGRSPGRIIVDACLSRQPAGPIRWPGGRFLGRRAAFVTLALLMAAGCDSRPKPSDAGQPSSSAPTRGGELIVSVRTEPQSFSWYTRHDATTDVVTFLTQARLVRVDRATQEIEPWLAESWTRSADGRRYTIKLRPDVAFADGHPFTAADVVFSFEAAYDERAGGPMMADTMMAGGRRAIVAAQDPSTVVIEFPVDFAPGLRILDNLPILPKHKLQAAFDAGTFRDAWTLSTPLDQITGLGPFVLREFTPRQRMVFSRNERYFRKDERGAPLPYLDRVVVDIVPDQNAQMLRLEAGQSDMMASEVRPEDYAALKRAADAGSVQLFDLGVSIDPDSFWINLKPGAFGNDPRAAWLQSEELRHAISYAVDRQVFADTVFLGAGEPVFGPVTPANRRWHSPDITRTPHDPARAKQLLAKIGLVDRNGDAALDDPRGGTARFTLSTMKGQTALERGGAVIRDELRKIGLTVDLVLLEGNALVTRLQSGKGYEAAYFHVGFTDTDHALNQEYWLSSGGAHIWHLGQKTPATAWERRIDELMAKYASEMDEDQRKKAFDEVLKIYSDHLPVLHFAAPRVFAAASARLTGLKPAVLRPQFLWSPDTIAVKASGTGSQRRVEAAPH